MEANALSLKLKGDLYDKSTVLCQSELPLIYVKSRDDWMHRIKSIDLLFDNNPEFKQLARLQANIENDLKDSIPLLETFIDTTRFDLTNVNLAGSQTSVYIRGNDEYKDIKFYQRELIASLQFVPQTEDSDKHFDAKRPRTAGKKIGSMEIVFEFKKKRV